MSERLKKKAIVLIALELVAVIALGGILFAIQTGLSVDRQKEDMAKKLTQIDALLSEAEVEEEETLNTYDGIYRTKAKSLAYMAAAGINPEITPSVTEEYRSVLNVDYVCIISGGEIIHSDGESAADFSSSELSPLFDTLSTGKSVGGIEPEGDGLRYYSSAIDEESFAVIGQSSEELHALLKGSSDLGSVLENVSVGLEGGAFAVAKDGSVISCKDEKIVGKNAAELGLDISAFEDGGFYRTEFNGERLFCSVRETDEAYIICAVTEEELNSSRSIAELIVIFIFFIVMTVLISYGIFLLNDREKQGGSVSLGRKLSVVAVLGLVCIFVSSYYMQTLFSISRHTMSNMKHTEEVERSLANHEETVEILKSRNDRSNLSKGQTAAYIITKRPDMINRASLREINRALGSEAVYVFDDSGRMSAASSYYTDFVLSDDPSSQSYDFRKLLHGVEYFIQEPMNDDTSGEFLQYIGVALRDENDDANGFVQVAVRPEKEQEALSKMDVGSLLNTIRVGTNGFAFSVNKDNKTFSYHPNEKYIGRSAEEYGLSARQLQGGYNDYIELGGKRYYASSIESRENYIYVALPEAELGGDELPVSLAATAISLVFIAIACLIILAGNGSSAAPTPTGGSPQFDIKMPDGTVRHTDSAASRWGLSSIAWDESTPEQKIAAILRVMVSVFVVLIGVAVLFRDKLFGEGSVLLYVIDGDWERGINIFAATACIIIICTVSVIRMALRRLLKILSKTLSARGETICRLLRSLVKYLSVIIALYLCFAMLGVDTKTLLASAGILSLVIGLGAQSLVSDILAGIFIIFEGEFRVGDIVTIDGWRGTVLEIGIRTTKIEDGGGDIKVVSNSSISGVVNMTKKHSIAMCDVGIEYGESLERVESILARELPLMQKRLPAVLEGPFYKGVTSLGDNSVNIRIIAKCEEGKRAQLCRDLNREMKIIFDKHDISIPFPQVVVNQTKVFKYATAPVRIRVELFARPQSILSRLPEEKMAREASEGGDS